MTSYNFITGEVSSDTDEHAVYTNAISVSPENKPVEIVVYRECPTCYLLVEVLQKRTVVMEFFWYPEAKPCPRCKHTSTWIRIQARVIP